MLKYCPSSRQSTFLVHPIQLRATPFGARAIGQLMVIVTQLHRPEKHFLSRVYNKQNTTFLVDTTWSLVSTLKQLQASHSRAYISPLLTRVTQTAAIYNKVVSWQRLTPSLFPPNTYASYFCNFELICKFQISPTSIFFIVLVLVPKFWSSRSSPVVCKMIISFLGKSQWRFLFHWFVNGC